MQTVPPTQGGEFMQVDKNSDVLGNPTPSRIDAVTTQRLKEAGELLEIRMVDHLVVGCGSGRSFSFSREGLFDGDVVKNYNRFKAEKEQER